LSIHYADGETQCQGKWNAAKGCFEGTVHQLAPAEDNDGTFYHSRDEVTHTFVLSPSTALCRRRISLWGADATGVAEAAINDFDRKADLLSAESLAITKHGPRT